MQSDIATNKALASYSGPANAHRSLGSGLEAQQRLHTDFICSSAVQGTYKLGPGSGTVPYRSAGVTDLGAALILKRCAHSCVPDKRARRAIVLC